MKEYDLNQIKNIKSCNKPRLAINKTPKLHLNDLSYDEILESNHSEEEFIENTLETEAIIDNQSEKVVIENTLETAEITDSRFKKSNTINQFDGKYIRFQGVGFETRNKNFHEKNCLKIEQNVEGLYNLRLED